MRQEVTTWSSNSDGVRRKKKGERGNNVEKKQYVEVVAASANEELEYEA